MNSDSGFEMASRTIDDVSQISLGAERGAENLMNDVNSARSQFGANSRCFNDYDSTVSAALEGNETLPMLSLAHAKNSFDKLDLDGSGDLTKDELIIARDHAGSQVEARMLTMLTSNFQDVRAAHESNKFIPWADDKKGITIDDLNAKLKEGESRMDNSAASLEKTERGLYMENIASDLMADRGASFAKLARGEKGGDDREITKNDLDVLLDKDESMKEFGSRELSFKERKAAEYLSKNWDSPEVRNMRRDFVTYPDETGREQWDKGGITMRSLEKGLFGFDPNEEQVASKSVGDSQQRIPDEDRIYAKNFNRLTKGDQQPLPPDYAGTEHTIDDRGLPRILPEDRPIDKPMYLGTGINRGPSDEPEYAERGWPTFDRMTRESERDIHMSTCELPEWKVQKGQYLWMIAEQSLVDNGNCKPSVREINDMTNLIAKENDMHRNDYLKVGQKLRIPQTRNGRR